MRTGQTAPADVREKLVQAGFGVTDRGKNPESIQVKKYNCCYILDCTSKGSWSPSGPPYFMVRGLDCELEDRGYQKFWHHKGKRFPVRLADLKTLHRFDEEVRALLDLKSLYHESLGSTCARSTYDRLNGRSDG